MAISASQVKELRERTGAGMMECKKALTETGGDIEAAIDHMRKSGLAKADKKAGRIAAEGLIVTRTSADGKRLALVEVNSETDFVAKGDDFINFAGAVAQRVLDSEPADMDTLMALPLADGDEENLDSAVKRLIAKIGENMNVRRFKLFKSDDTLAVYQHGVRIGVVVEMKGGDVELARDIAMHVAASRPVCVSESDVPAALLDKEKEIFSAQAAESGKPPEIIEKMVVGRIKKYLKEVTLLGQPFVKDPDVSVEKLLKDRVAEVVTFERFELGEGIEKKSENFADEVMSQVKGG